MSNLLTDWQRLKPGDEYRIPPGSYDGPIRVEGLEGQEGAPIRILGGPGVRFAGDGGKAAPFCLRFDNCPWVEFGEGGVLVEECMGFEARGIQVFTSDHFTIRSATTKRIWLDDIHEVGCNDFLCEYHLADGAGDKAGRSGAIGAHAFYATCLDGGQDCHGITYRDSSAVNVLGACFQANGDTGFLTGVLFERVKGMNYGQMGGAGFNLAACNVILRDITLGSRWPDAAGVRGYEGATVTVERYAIQLVHNLPLSGVGHSIPGTPELPHFRQPSPAPPSPPAPTDPGGDKEQQIKTLQAVIEGQKQLLVARRGVTDKLVRAGYVSLTDARNALDKLEAALKEAEGSQ